MKNVSVSHGTLRPQDIIPAFLDALRHYAPEVYAGYAVMLFGPVPAWVMDEGDSCEWWDSEEASELVAELIDALSDAAPSGFYFGAHPGDGSDFGFWEHEA